MPIEEGDGRFRLHDDIRHRRLREDTDVTPNVESLLRDLEEAKDEAFRVYKANRASGSEMVSVAFDAGRHEGLKQAIEIIASK